MDKTTEKMIKLTLDLHEAEVIKKALSEYWANNDGNDVITAERLLQAMYRLTMR